jgi:predicted DNA-binding protein (MmcQ/YjbR family)
MRYADIDAFCRSLPAATLAVQWGGSHVYKVGAKMFAMQGAESERPRYLMFKAGELSFAILTQAPHIVPAPYFARAQWVMLERLDALGAKDLKAYLAQAHQLVAAKLPRKVRDTLGLPR